jgi:hypothetical protein
MLNKNDPLIGAVQEVMKKNQAERDAAKLVNEKFGIHDRRALPHEKQGEWDSAYKQVLSEGLHPNQQKLDVHEPEKDKLTKHDFKMLSAKKKPMEEGSDVTSPSSMGIKKPDYATGTPDYAKSKEQTVNRAAKTSLPAGTMKEEKSDKFAKVMREFKKRKLHSGSKEGPVVTDSKQAKAIAASEAGISKKTVKEGFNNRHDSSVTASAEKQVVAALNEKVGNPLLLNKAKARVRIGDTGIRRTISGTNDVQTRLANLRKSGASLDNTRNAELDKPGLEKAGVAQALKDPKAREVLAQTTKDAAEFAVPSALTGGPVGKMISRGAGALISKGYNYLKGGKTAAAATKTTAAATKPATTTAAQTTTTAGQAAAAALARNKRVSAVRRPAGAKPVQPAAKPQATSASGVPAVARTPGNKIGIGLPKAERAGPWNRVGPNAPAAGNAARMAARQRLSATARDIRAGAGKVVSAVKNNPKLAAGAAAGAALGGFAATQLANKPSETSAMSPTVKARQQLAAVGNQTGGVNKITNAQPAKPAPAPAKPAPATTTSAPATPAPAKPAPAATTPAVKPAKPAPVQAVRKVAPQDSSTPAQRAQFNRQVDRGNAAPGTQYKGLGVKTGTTIQQKAAPQVKKPVGMGRVK